MHVCGGGSVRVCMCVVIVVCVCVVCRHRRMSSVMRLVNSSLPSSVSVDVHCCEVVTCSHVTFTQHSPDVASLTRDFWRSVLLIGVNVYFCCVRSSFSIPSQETGFPNKARRLASPTKPRDWLGECLRNDLFCVEWYVQP